MPCWTMETACKRNDNAVDAGMPWIVDSRTTLDLQHSGLFGNPISKLRPGGLDRTDGEPASREN